MPVTLSLQPSESPGQFASAQGAAPTPGNASSEPIASAFPVRNQAPWDYDEEGDPIYQNDDATLSLAAAVKRLWEERPGDFAELTAESLRKDAQLKGKGKMEEEAQAPSAEPRPTGEGGLSCQELSDMRYKMRDHLQQMNWSLETGLNLLNVMLGPLDPTSIDPATLPLPAGSLAPSSISTAHLPAASAPAKLLDSAVSLAHKRKAITEASAVLARAADETLKGASRSKVEWDQLIELREAGWRMKAVGARPGAGASIVGRGAGRAAKNIAIDYAPFEAAQALSQSSLATLTTLVQKPLDAEVAPGLVFPPRPRRRLQITFVKPGGETHSFNPWSSVNSADTSHHGNLDKAKAEIFEEELFAELAREARAKTELRCRVSDESISVDELEYGGQLCFNMIEPYRAGVGATSPLACLVSGCLRLFLTSVYRRRRDASFLTQGPLRTRPLRTLVLEPLLSLLAYYARVHALHDKLSKFAQMLEDVGIPTVLEFEPIEEDSHTIISVLSAASDFVGTPLGGTSTLRIAQRSKLSFLTSCPSNVAISLSGGPLSINPRRLGNTINIEVAQLLAQELGRVIRTDFIGWHVTCEAGKTLATRRNVAVRFSVLIGDAITCTVVVARKWEASTTLRSFPGQRANSKETLPEWVKSVLTAQDAEAGP